MLAKIPAAERYLSTLLGNIEIAHQPHEPVTMAQDYLQQLHRLTASVTEEKSQRVADVALIHTNVDGVQLVVEWYWLYLCFGIVTHSLNSCSCLMFGLESLE